jgi:hypothetical protein
MMSGGDWLGESVLVMGKNPSACFCGFSFVSFRLGLSPFAVPVGCAACVGADYP